jgi:membrane associated rhomboid family serine protease
MFNRKNSSMPAKDSFVDSHRSRVRFIAAVLFLVVAAINLTIGVAHHENIMVVAAVFGFVAGVLLFRSAKRLSA